VLFVHLGSSLEKTRVKIEDITREGLSTRRSSKKERHLSVSDGLLGKIVIDDESVLSIVSEVFSDSATRVRSQELKRSGFGSGGSNDDRVFESIMVSKNLHNVSDG
jgi:hypothetical protein